ncbi:MAG: elongation factor G, partial [Methylobacteriaceae bacterium]|nr:elongation factor G [Methylobacteriaceae bacterium]
GVLAGFPVVDVRAVLIDWAWHATDSRPPAFEIASRAAFREGLEKGRSVLLEPIMKVDVRAPEACAEPIIRDLQARRGVVESPGAQRPRTAILARAPLADLFGFAHRVRSLTPGAGGFTMRYDRYAPVSEDGSPDDFRPAMALRA